MSSVFFFMKCQFYFKKCLPCLFPCFHFSLLLFISDLCYLLCGVLQKMPDASHPFRFSLYAVSNHNSTWTQPQGKPTVAAPRLKSKCLSMIFKALSTAGPRCLSGFSSWDGLVTQRPRYPWHLTNSLICCVRSCFCDLVQTVSSTPIILLFLLCLVEPVHPLRHSPMEWNLYRLLLSYTTDSSIGWLIKRVEEGN